MATLTEISLRVVQDAGFANAQNTPWYYNAGSTTDDKMVRIYRGIREADRDLRQWFRNHGNYSLLLESGSQAIASGSEVALTVTGLVAATPGRVILAMDSDKRKVQCSGIELLPELEAAAFKAFGVSYAPGVTLAQYRIIFTKPGYVMLKPPPGSTKTITFYFIRGGGEYANGAASVTGPEWFLDLLVRKSIVLLKQSVGRPSETEKELLNEKLSEYMHDRGYMDTDDTIIVDGPP